MKYSEETIRGTIQKSIKWINRYGNVDIRPDGLLEILHYADRGLNCKKQHISITDALSIVKYFKEKEINDPYLKQFIKRCTDMVPKY